MAITRPESGANREIEARLLDPSFLEDPYPAYTLLRSHSPVHWFEPWRCWVLTRHEDIGTLLREDGRAVSSAGRTARIFAQLRPEVRDELMPIEQHYASGLAHSDPPDHTRLRRMINKAFTPKVVDQLRPRIQDVIDELLDAAEAKGEFDLVDDFAFPLPAIIVATLLGIDADDREQTKVWANDISVFAGSNAVTEELARQALESLLAARAYLGRIADERRNEPRDDVISRLVAAQAAGEPITDDEILNTCMTFVVGGHETTTALISNAILALEWFPTERKRLYGDPELMPSAVEEFLRFEAPIQRVLRLARSDLELGGRHIRRGDSLMLVLAAANRDPEVFDEPEVLRIDRSPNRHLTFAVGPHFCIGGPLARLEAQLALSALCDRFPHLRVLDQQPSWVLNPALRMLTGLEVAVE